MRKLPPPQPGLHNVLCATSTPPTLSYLSATARHLLPAGATLPPVRAHAASAALLATAAARVTVHSSERVRTLAQVLHFRPCDIAVHPLRSRARVVVAGPDGAFFADFDMADGPHDRGSERGRVVNVGLVPLPGSAGYSIVCVAARDTLVAAAAVDGRVAVWDCPTAPACEIIDAVPSFGDRVTGLSLTDGGLLVAWWSGRLVYYELVRGRGKGSAKWTMDGVRVAKDVFPGRPGCHVVERAGLVAMVTGRGDLVFVRLSDGGYCKTRVGEYVKGFCEHDGRLQIFVDGKLVTREWISKEDLDKAGVMTLVRPNKKEKADTDSEKESNGKTDDVVEQ